VQTLGGRGLTVSGLGGEIYRNAHFTSRRRVDFKEWMINHVYYTHPRRVLGAARARDLHAFILGKMIAELDIDLREPVDQLAIRRYLGEIHGPQCEGTMLNAPNQLAFCLAPFTDHAIVREAYRAIPHLGLGGRFQAAMMARLDASVAEIPNSWGFPPTREPFFHRVYALVKGYVPDRIWNARRELACSWRGVSSNGHQSVFERLPHSVTLAGIKESLREAVPEVNLEWCLRDTARTANVLFLGSFLRELQSHLRF
jgi:hypothetical protein